MLVAIGDRREEAERHHQRARFRSETGRFADARNDLERAAAIFGELRDEARRAMTVAALGALFEDMDASEEAEAAYRDAVELFERAAPELPAHGAALVGLARSRVAGGELRSARPLVERAAAILQETAPEFAEDARVFLAEIREALDDETVEVTGDVEDPDWPGRIRLWVRRAASELPDAADDPLHVHVGVPPEAPDWLVTAADLHTLWIHPRLLRERGPRSELRLGWHIHQLVVHRLLMRRGIMSDGWIGSFLISFAGEWFARRSFVGDDDEEAPFGPSAPKGAEDVDAAAGTLGAAVAGSASARANLDAWLVAQDPTQPLPGLVTEWLTNDLAIADATELVDAMAEIWRTLGGALA